MIEWIQRLPTRDGDPLLGKVRLLREVGRGGMGVVFAGWHIGMDVPVAVKLLLQVHANSEAILARFRRERLDRHPRALQKRCYF